MRACTRQELAEVLRRRNVPPEAAETVLDRMAEVGLVNDADFAQSWVESRQQRRHASRAVLRRELQRKGVDRELIEDAVQKVSGSDEMDAARALAEKRLRALRGYDPGVRRRRVAGALARRGFSADTVTMVLRDLDFGAGEGDAVDGCP